MLVDLSCAVAVDALTKDVGLIDAGAVAACAVANSHAAPFSRSAVASSSTTPASLSAPLAMASVIRLMAS